MTAADYGSWTLERLEAKAADLAEKRTEIRLEQNAVADAIAIKRAVEGLPESARNALTVRLGGNAGAKGGVAAGKED